MREKKEEFEKRGVRLVCVVQGTAEETARFCGRHGLDGICIPDPMKLSYRAMGFPRARWRDLLMPGGELRRRREEAKAAGCRVSLAGTLQEHSDVLQLPGAALVARGGRILWLYRGVHAADLPPAEELLKTVDHHPVR